MENDPRCIDREPVNGSEEEIEPDIRTIDTIRSTMTLIMIEQK